MKPDLESLSCINATVACGSHVGKRLFIPRIPLVPSDNISPINVKREQFPVRPAFAVTANKAQSQMLKKIGIPLQKPFFSHGQRQRRSAVWNHADGRDQPPAQAPQPPAQAPRVDDNAGGGTISDTQSSTRSGRNIKRPIN
ncbi:PIF1 helicase [Elysia marginata]|uniref:PIF1 helicase n=1 Tax=Elysia marginata TaxID=1093978 RepID=A0AAV4GHZ0_9GAST|nr:PIF1 helicase [Elysia marginata]